MYKFNAIIEGYVDYEYQQKNTLEKEIVLKREDELFLTKED